ncbi:acetolactate synthase small subunit [Desulfitobacterium sp. LBE]|uniref:Acetolactate synthase small subunit n=5 Tax=root TaxID=1 RepID=Q24XT6_DESHY|nr:MULTISPECIES: acetolactate synthase small subunit [Desulfitobacterium]ACL20511.1 acetolactate synthase, small subunit [Desulfitobacterium hafniense DCB-2]EHL04442.1 acetolactate synthase, small subunit [Desulfitobacterium hafniense DP7]KTE92403.1 acetolactate synthase small subunit [Desulfitobacterium hafniense]MEA5024526.1 acetolactate synthase small subunit [Desulfitobacterium hafniense]TWH56658.1 acetolactate synthase small subunit [Desulfitobacterium sp. LBE]
MLHTLAVLVENNPGVLTRVAGLFARRAYNINSLSVCQTEHPGISRMTIVVDGDDTVIEQVSKQLHKLVVVHKVTDLTNETVVDRELALIRIKVKADTRLEVLQIVDVFRGRVVDMGRSNLTVELTGDEEKIDAFVKTIRPFGLMELVRTGKIAITRLES